MTNFLLAAGHHDKNYLENGFHTDRSQYMCVVTETRWRGSGEQFFLLAAAKFWEPPTPLADENQLLLRRSNRKSLLLKVA